MAEAARLAEAVDLLPVGALPPGTLEALAARLSRRVELACHVLPPRELPLRRIPNRDQIDANALLEALEARATSDSRLLVGVAGEDIAVPLFTFVFGLARQGGRACVVSLARTDPVVLRPAAGPRRCGTSARWPRSSTRWGTSRPSSTARTAAA